MEHSNIYIPRKSMFKQDEVCTLTGVKPYVLRFWENEFDEINPIVSSTGGKLYEREDIEFILKVKGLLFDQKLTIEKVKKQLQKKSDEKSNSHHTLAQKEKSSESMSIESSVRDNIVRGHRDVNFDAIDDVKDLLNGIISQTNSIQESYGWI